jgi:PIN domain nuclease of toxin-antitoxin system
MMGSPKLSRKVRHLFEDESTGLFLSAASLWEIALKSDKGKIHAPLDEIDESILAFGIKELPVRTVHVRQAWMLPRVEGHKDPFDRLIAAQAIFEGMPLVTHDPWLLRHYTELATVW